MTINRTTLLDLPLPVTGTESGTWGDIVNNGLSEYIDISVAGSLSLSADSDTNLSSTEGNAAGTNIGSTTAQYAILRCTGARTATRNINAPAWAISGGTLTNYSKIYIVVNETTGSQNIVLRATDSATPTYTTGVTIVPGERAVCAWNGSDFVKVGGAAGGSTTQIQFNNAGVFGGSANLTWDGTNVQIGATGALRLADTDSSNYVAFKSPSTVASNVTWTLPSADGTNGQALTTNGSGTLAFSSVTTSPGGSTTQVQYNNAGAFGGISNATTDGTTLSMTSPKVITGINDTNGNELLKVTATASAVNELTLANAATGGNPVLSATGGDTNIGITLTPKGTGGVVFPAGAVGTPAITTTGDTNTGVFFPAADTVALSTGGSERMRIDSSGRLLVGTATARSDFFNTTTVIPAFQVELASAANLNRFISATSNNSDTGGANLLLAKSRGTTVGAVTIVQNDDQIGAISFQGADGVDMVEAARIEAKVDGTPGSNDMPGSLRFYTTADGAASSTERMRIDSAGNVSIGTTPPTIYGDTPRLLLYGGASSTSPTIEVAQNGTGVAYHWQMRNGNGIVGWMGTDNTSFVFGTGTSTERMRITPQGGLAVGQPNIEPGSGNILVPSNGTIFGNNSSNSRSYIELYNSSTGDMSIAATYTTAVIKFLTGGITTPTERMRIDSSGRVGIGVTPSSGSGYSQRLQIKQADGDYSGLQIQKSDDDSLLGVGYWTTTAAFSFIASYNSTGSYLPICFVTSGTQRMRITSGGEVYIAGTTDQGAYNLQVNGTGVWGAGAYVNGSDERLKDNIQTLNDGLAVVSQLRPVTFQYKPEHSKDQSVQPGFIAQELQQAMDGKAYLDGVVQSGPEYLNVAYQNLIPILTKAIQEQQALITSLTARVAALEGTQP